LGGFFIWVLKGLCLCLAMSFKTTPYASY
jgi:hypothetical protein